MKNSFIFIIIIIITYTVVTQPEASASADSATSAYSIVISTHLKLQHINYTISFSICQHTDKNFFKKLTKNVKIYIYHLKT